MLNNHMEKNTKTAKKANGHGGARKGAGRPPGSKSEVTIKGLLESLDKHAPGTEYEDLLIQDFLTARNDGDSNLTLKYHNLILNKVMSSLAKVEVTDSKDIIEAKQAAFADALAKLVGNSKD